MEHYRNRRMILVAMIMAVLLSGCASQEGKFKKALEQDTIQAYELYLHENQDSEFATKAEENLMRLRFEAAMASDEPGDLYRFRHRYPRSPLTREVIQRIEELEFATARNEGTETAYRSFLSRNPRSAQAEDAKAALKEIRNKELCALVQGDDREAVAEILREGSREEVQQVLECGLDAAGLGPDGDPWIFLAIRADRRDLLEALLDKGADLRALTEKGGGAMTIAAWNGSAQIAPLLLEQGFPVDECEGNWMSPMAVALIKGHEEFAQYMVENGADVDKVYQVSEPEMKLTLLTWGVDFGKPDVVRFLVENGADLEFKDKDGRTPLVEILYAREKDYKIRLEIAEMLVEAGADVNARDKWGVSNFKRAFASGFAFYDLMDEMLRRGHRLSRKDTLGVLMEAATSSWPQKVEKLREMGFRGNINEQLREYAKENWNNDMCGPDRTIRRAEVHPYYLRSAGIMDYHETYRNYLEKCPDGFYVAEAKERLAFLESKKSEASIAYPTVVSRAGKKWEWKTVFSEKGGDIGFRIQGSGWLHDAQGERWGNAGTPVHRLSRGPVEVGPGSTAEHSYWISSPDHKFCNSTVSYTWKGQDQAGNRIEFEERVYLRHKGCPHQPEKE